MVAPAGGCCARSPASRSSRPRGSLPPPRANGELRLTLAREAGPTCSSRRAQRRGRSVLLLRCRRRGFQGRAPTSPVRAEVFRAVIEAAPCLRPKGWGPSQSPGSPPGEVEGRAIVGSKDSPWRYRLGALGGRALESSPPSPALHAQRRPAHLGSAPGRGRGAALPPLPTTIGADASSALGPRRLSIAGFSLGRRCLAHRGRKPRTCQGADRTGDAGHAGHRDRALAYARRATSSRRRRGAVLLGAGCSLRLWRLKGESECPRRAARWVSLVRLRARRSARPLLRGRSWRRRAWLRYGLSSDGARRSASRPFEDGGCGRRHREPALR